ncbi:hypothetical protein [Microbulbifer halophilus]|uniref:Amidohydrolase-related domain-containing protein n=1 Tax=Microbulbifer halophilus TaxID=453963 RepID=A0ABW5EHR8_9GAMM|nr:hypothetical protein [Microbulbifer halophilus]MCW8127675.1 hypothetical protein [Microbulbifer halophilus]
MSALGFLRNEIDLRDKIFDEILKVVDEFSASCPSNSWITGRGWNPVFWSGKRWSAGAGLDALEIGLPGRCGCGVSTAPWAAAVPQCWKSTATSTATGAYAWRTLLDQGTRIAAGSDFPVEAGESLYRNPRRGRQGEPADGWIQEQKMRLAEALQASPWTPPTRPTRKR